MTDEQQTVVSLAERGRWNLRDVPKGLRYLADQIEAGHIEAEAVTVVTMDAEQEVKVFGYGDCGDNLRAAGILSRAVTYLNLNT